MLELWELGGRADCRFSTFSWRTRLALHHKGLTFAAHPVAISDKGAIGFSGQGKVPILKHDGRVVTDSWAIALYLEKEFPGRRCSAARSGKPSRMSSMFGQTANLSRR
jgi:glutathione S-transferase